MASLKPYLPRVGALRALSLIYRKSAIPGTRLEFQINRDAVYTKRLTPPRSMPLAAFKVVDIEKEYKRLKTHSVVFTGEPTQMGPVKIAVFSDTCGNLIQLYQPT